MNKACQIAKEWITSKIHIFVRIQIKHLKQDTQEINTQFKNIST